MPLFYHSGALGDFLLSLPLLRALRRVQGQEDWAMAAGEEPAALVGKLFPHRRRLSPGGLEFAPFTRRRLEPSRIVELLKRFGGLFGFLPRGQEIEAIARKHAPRFPCALGEPFVTATSGGRSIEEVLTDVLSRLEEGRGEPEPEEFALKLEELPALGHDMNLPSFLVQGKQKTALIHPGAGDRAKVAPGALYVEVARGLEANGFAVGWVYGPVEAERRDGAPPLGPRVDCPSLVLLAHAMARVDLYLGNDTGPTHLAAAIGAPTVSIHGKSNPAWRPRGKLARVVGGEGSFPSSRLVLETALELVREAKVMPPPAG